MRACIHRGAAEIGGNCVELESQGRRLVLDVGRPLWAEPGEHVPLPRIQGLDSGDDPSLLGVVVSHSHPDHYGLAGLLPQTVPLFMGEATSRILREAAYFTPVGLDREPTAYLADRSPIEIGPFRLTPYLVDHSAFDAYALLIEGDGRRLFYSGDIRAHGRKAYLFERLVSEPPEGINVLLLEGTRLGRPRAEGDLASEVEVEERCVDLFGTTQGIVLAAFSMQNIDRLVSLYKAALRSDRDLVLDLYGAAITMATGRDKIPQPGWDRVKFFVPQSQRVRVLRSRQFERIRAIGTARLFPEQLAERRAWLVLTFRPSMIAELEQANCLAGAAAVWSMWPGYLREPRMRRLHDFLEHYGIPLHLAHASGHATVADLRRLAEALVPTRIVPIHTAVPERFDELFSSVDAQPDGEWWEV